MTVSEGKRSGPLRPDPYVAILNDLHAQGIISRDKVLDEGALLDYSLKRGLGGRNACVILSGEGYRAEEVDAITAMRQEQEMERLRALPKEREESIQAFSKKYALAQEVQAAGYPPPPDPRTNPGKSSLTGEIVGDKYDLNKPAAWESMGSSRTGTPLPPFYALFRHLPKRLFGRYMNWCMRTEHRWNA